MPLEWDYTRMTTRIPEIDAEHQEWIRRYNEFDRAVMQGRGMEVIKATLNFLEEYAEAHFQHEESVAVQVLSPVQTLNHENHNQYRAQLHEIRRWMEWEGASAVEVVSLKQDMEHWLFNHICKVDTKILPATAG